MVSHMKTTIQIPDSLFNEARKLANEEQTTLKALMEEGLRRIISEHRQRGSFKLRSAIFKGNGLQSNMEGANWERIRDISYEGRGS
ncbi:MAG: type II toxin-antitoxin system VapB family antitoxin [Nitrospirae bacterium]|nr:type II toxin-antitoxin system VapB family antitoxin [Nitrospirota bacterium]